MMQEDTVSEFQPAVSRIRQQETSVVEAAILPLETLMIRPVPRWKRPMDIFGAIAGLLAFSPVMLVTALAIKLTSKGPALFKQWRTGLGGQPFTFYKFRSMYDGTEHERDGLLPYNEQSGPAFKIRNDPRVTWVGRLIRKWSIDELPQLWNVLKGDMTLVGPRPLPVQESLAVAPWQRCRLLVRPGLTCFWQVSGRLEIGFDDWMRLDIRYLRTQSLLTDLKIMCRTPFAVLSCKGAC